MTQPLRRMDPRPEPIVDRAGLDAWLKANRGQLVDQLVSLVAINSTSPAERRAHEELGQICEDAGATVDSEPLVNDVWQHPLAGPHPGGTPSPNLTAVWGGGSDGALLISAHVDVVPAGHGYPRAFAPEVRDGKVFGRGAIDVKGSIVALVGAIRFLTESGQVASHDLQLDLVTLEESGGTGTLSTLLLGRRARGVLVLEPTGLIPYRGHRGCVGITLTIAGSARHMGSGGTNPIADMAKAIELLGDFEQDLIRAARRDPAYADIDRPVQVNLGTIRGGHWHGAVPDSCSLHVNIGFIHTDTAATIEQALRSRLAQLRLGERLVCHADGIRNEALCGQENGWLSEIVDGSLRRLGRPGCRPAWQVSCDARLYRSVADLEPIVLGVGDLAQAHSSEEYLAVEDLDAGIEVFAEILLAVST